MGYAVVSEKRTTLAKTNPMFAKPLKIVTVRQLGGIGDCLMLTPVFRGLREKYPKAKIMHVTGLVYLGGALMDVFEHVPRGFIDEIHTFEPYDATTLRTREVWAKFYGKCPAIEEDEWWKKADLHFDFNTPCVDYEWNAMRSEGGIQKSRTQAWCESANVDPSSYRPMYTVTPDEKKWAANYFHERGLEPKNCIALGIAACDTKRALGVGKLHDICAGIAQAGFTPVVVDPTFHFNEYPYFNALRLRDLMSLIEQVATVVSVDSGLLHMAGTLGVPVVGIFGPTDYKMRMGHYRGSAIDSRKLMPCAPCWYEYGCTHAGSPIKPFSCLNKIGANVIVEEALRWAKYQNESRTLLPIR